jgi:hypothetical protein
MDRFRRRPYGVNRRSTAVPASSKTAISAGTCPPKSPSITRGTEGSNPVSSSGESTRFCLMCAARRLRLAACHGGILVACTAGRIWQLRRRLVLDRAALLTPLNC